MWVMGKWAVGQWIVGVISFQKIYGLYSVKHQEVEKWSYYASCGWILWVGWVVWVMGAWAVGHWIMGVTSFQKIYGLYSVEHNKVEKWSYYVGCGWVLWVWSVCVGDG